jgi:hypothetical protein
MKTGTGKQFREEAFMARDSVRVCQNGDCTLLQIPWAKADAWHSHFRKLGVVSTLCLDPLAEEACLELRGVQSADLASLMPVSI